MGAITDKIKGKMKKIEGRVTGDKIRETQGAGEETKGDVEGAVTRTKTRAKARVREAQARSKARRAARKNV